MTEEEFIEIQAFCIRSQAEPSFLEALCEAGLLVVENRADKKYFPASQVPELEKMIRFHYEMDINLEGIEVIQHLLQQMQQMQREKLLLQQRLSVYEW